MLVEATGPGMRYFMLGLEVLPVSGRVGFVCGVGASNLAVVG